MLTAKVVLDVIPHQLGTGCVSRSGDRPVYLPKHTTLGIALPSPVHTMSTGPASSGLAKVKKRGEHESEVSSITDCLERSEDEFHVGLDE